MFKRNEVITLNAVLERIKESGASVTLNAEDYAEDRAIIYNLSETDWVNEEGATYGFLYWEYHTDDDCIISHHQGNLTLKEAMSIAFNRIYSEMAYVPEGENSVTIV